VSAVVEITDLLPIGDTEDDLPMLMRRVRVVSGRATFRLRCAVRHDYARAKTLARLDGKDVIFSAADQPSLRLSADQPLTIDGNVAVTEFTLEQDQTAEFCSAPSTIRAWEGAADLCLERTLKFWRDWIGQSSYRGRWREMVNRSALAMKLLTSRKHGAILAADLRPAGKRWRRTQLGLSLHLDPRRLVHRLRLHAPGFRRRGQRLHALAAWAGQ
jgi:GH15 family glucan-1,4-alpha-glucosidase